MELVFMRHGIAVERGDPLAPVEFERYLTTEGAEKVKQIAKHLSKIGSMFDMIISSPFVRARQTAEIVAKTLNLEKKLILDERLSAGATIAKILALASEYKNSNSLLFVGHEPDLGDAVSHLAGIRSISIKKGGLAGVRISEFGPGKGDLLYFIPPKMLLG